MKLLVSPQSLSEAKVCISSNSVDIIDVKRPAEGSLGANFPWIIRDIRKIAPPTIPISATLGDVSFQPGTVSLAALGAATAGASFVKVGLFVISSIKQGIEIMSAVKHTMNEYNFSTKVVAAGYAEGKTINSLNPLDIPIIASEANCDYAMIDTFNKKIGKSIFDLLSFEQLSQFIQQSRERGLRVALGGSIKKAHIPLLKQLKPDIVGVRGCVCENNDRNKGSMTIQLIEEFYQAMQ